MIIMVRTWGFLGGKKETSREGLERDMELPLEIGRMVLDLWDRTDRRCDSFIVTVIPDPGDEGGEKRWS